jgi:hypothetical protein
MDEMERAVIEHEVAVGAVAEAVGEVGEEHQVGCLALPSIASRPWVETDVNSADTDAVDVAGVEDETGGVDVVAVVDWAMAYCASVCDFAWLETHSTVARAAREVYNNKNPTKIQTFVKGLHQVERTAYVCRASTKLGDSEVQ